MTPVGIHPIQLTLCGAALERSARAQRGAATVLMALLVGLAVMASSFAVVQ